MATKYRYKWYTDSMDWTRILNIIHKNLCLIRKIRVLINCCCILLLLAQTPTSAQEFKTTAKIANIKANGLHNILLSPEIRSYSETDWHDVRLFDATNHEVPYFIWTKSEAIATNFEALPIVSKQSIPKAETQVIFENTTNKSIAEIVLKTANSSLVKDYNLSGSNDQKQWFGLINKSQLTDLQNNKDTVIFTIIAFPLSAYRYFKLDINDKKTAAINVLKVGYLKNTKSHLKQLSLTPKSTKTTEDTQHKKIHIEVNFERVNVIDNLIFEIKSPQFYRRNARILASRTTTDRKKSKTVLEPITEFELQSGSKNTVLLSGFAEKMFVIEIDNEDNQPLGISSLTINQLATYLVADLKTNERYSLKTGNKILPWPNYDISYFENSISKQLPEATITNLTVNDDTPKRADIRLRFWQRPWFLWICLGVAAISIFYFASGLLRDMK